MPLTNPVDPSQSIVSRDDLLSDAQLFNRYRADLRRDKRPGCETRRCSGVLQNVTAPIKSRALRWQLKTGTDAHSGGPPPRAKNYTGCIDPRHQTAALDTHPRSFLRDVSDPPMVTSQTPQRGAAILAFGAKPPKKKGRKGARNFGHPAECGKSSVFALSENLEDCFSFGDRPKITKIRMIRHLEDFTQIANASAGPYPPPIVYSVAPMNPSAHRVIVKIMAMVCRDMCSLCRTNTVAL